MRAAALLALGALLILAACRATDDHRAPASDPVTVESLTRAELRARDALRRGESLAGPTVQLPDPPTATSTPTLAPTPVPTPTPAPAYRAQAPSAGAGVERWRSLVASIFPAWAVEAVLRVMSCESGGDPYATGSAGERGLMQVHPLHHDSTYDPAGNLLAAYRISGGGTTWAAWSCRP